MPLDEVLLSGRSWHEANCRSGVNLPQEGTYGSRKEGSDPSIAAKHRNR